MAKTLTHIKLLRFLSLLILFQILLSCQPDNDSSASSYDVRNSITGYWKVEETSSEYGDSKYTVQITAENDSDGISIDNFYNIGDGKKVKGIVRQNYLIDIPTQTVDGFIFHGNGTINSSSNHITFSYTADDQGGIIDTVSAGYTK